MSTLSALPFQQSSALLAAASTCQFPSLLQHSGEQGSGLHQDNSLPSQHTSPPPTLQPGSGEGSSRGSPYLRRGLHRRLQDRRLRVARGLRGRRRPRICLCTNHKQQGKTVTRGCFQRRTAPATAESNAGCARARSCRNARGQRHQGLQLAGEGETKRGFEELLKPQMSLYPGFPFPSSHLTRGSSQERGPELLQRSNTALDAAAPLPAQRADKY